MRSRRGAPTPRQLRALAGVGEPDLSPADVVPIQQVLIDTGAVHELEARIKILVAEALAAVVAAPLTAEARTGLADLAYAVGWREK